MDPHPVAAGTGAAQRDDPGARIRTAVGARSGLEAIRPTCSAAR